MSGNSIPPGYHPQDELWTQDTVVFDAVRDDHEPPGEPRGNRPKESKASKYAIIGLTATIAVSVLAIGGLVVSGHSRWDAAPTTANGPAPTRILLTTTTSARPTTTTAPQAADVTTAPDPTTTTAATSATTTTTATATVIAVGGPCGQTGQTAVTADGMVLTCDVAGDSTPRWLPITKPSLGFPCNATEAGTFGYAANGGQLVCTRRNGTNGTPSYVWDSPGAVTGGKHEPGEICNLKKDVVAQSSSGRAVYCMPANGSNSPYIGTWKTVS
ncbi:hypothetical protein [Nocardia aurantiaca]|uniref:Uncharacterized protein n=1 Tax=Nocardia aurantiaca TaxID=2675850 RepID=A0A6I3L4A0_9NOCA|nr:hypothetical protein [Nocardia aurantiaca]MTE15770.1 hypothetical protein [Nocardia aurantiaca]